MKLRNKLILFNAISKLLIAGVFIIFIPLLIDRIAINHTDKRLVAMKENVMKTIGKVGLGEFIREEQDSAFASYNIFKEEFISIEPAKEPLKEIRIGNATRNIEEENIDYRILSYTFTNNNQLYLLETGKSLATLKTLDSTLKHLAFIILSIVLAISIMIDFGFASYLLRPFRAIINKVRSTHDPATFNFRPIQTTTTDFEYLDQSINEMMEKIQHAFSHEREFIGNVSHELLTPLSILQSRIENLLSDSKTPEHVSLKLVESQKTLSRLNKIINALLLISKIENEQFLKKDTVDLRELANEVLGEIEERFAVKNITVENNLQPELTVERCNRDLLFTMLFNLVSNAIKYNKKSGKIFLRGWLQEAHPVLEIEDTGIGISRENIATLFNRFKKQTVEGLESHGLGLPIVKTIANFHGIQIKIDSREGAGTVFRLSFNKF